MSNHCGRTVNKNSVRPVVNQFLKNTQVVARYRCEIVHLEGSCQNICGATWWRTSFSMRPARTFLVFPWPPRSTRLSTVVRLGPEDTLIVMASSRRSPPVRNLFLRTRPCGGLSKLVPEQSYREGKTKQLIRFPSGKKRGHVKTLVTMKDLPNCTTESGDAARIARSTGRGTQSIRAQSHERESKSQNKEGSRSGTGFLAPVCRLM